MSIQFTVPGFEPMTFAHESPPITTRPGLPPNLFAISQCVPKTFKILNYFNLISYFKRV